jgi:guanine deaminase
VETGLGTDVGAGTSLSLLRTLGDAYKVGQLNGQPMDAVRGLYLATLGGARAMGLADRIGGFAPGMEADFVVLDPAATPILAYRNARSASIAESLFVLMTLGDDRAVKATWVAGRPAGV